MTRPRFLRRLLQIGALACAAVAASALPAAAADQKDQPAKVGTLAFSSLDELQAEAHRLGIDLPPGLSEAGLERLYRLGQGGLAVDRPAGVMFYWEPGWDMQAGHGVIAILPVHLQAMTMDMLKNLGGLPIDGHPDTVNLNNVLFRRTDQDLMWSMKSDPDLLGNANPVDLTALFDPQSVPVPGDHVFFRCLVSGKEVRQLYPDSGSDWVRSLSVKTRRPPGQSNQSWRQEQEGERWAQDGLAGLDRIDFTLGRSADDLALRLAIAPAKLPPLGAFRAPGMPADVVGRIDLAGPIADVFPDTRDAFLKLMWPECKDRDGRSLPPDQLHDLQALCKSTAGVFLGGNAVSAGVEPLGQSAVVFVVDQQVTGDWAAQERDLLAPFDKLAERMNQPTQTPHVELQHYDSEFGSVQRLVIRRQSPSFTAYIDGVEIGGDVLLAIAGDDGRHVLDLAKQKQGKLLAHLLTADINLEQSWALAPKPMLQLFLGPKYDDVTALLKGQNLRFTMDSQKDAAIYSMTLSEDWVKQAIKIFLPTSEPPAPPSHEPHGGGL